MSCLKCGKSTQDEQVFCSQCLAGMEAYPVKPDVHVTLPHRPDGAGKRSGKKKRAPSIEEQLVLLRVKQRRLKWTVFWISLFLCAAVGLLIYLWLKPDTLEWGKNYIVEIPFS